METNKDKFLKIVSNHDSSILKEAEFRLENKDWLRKSKRISAKILIALDEQGMSQKDLASKMGVSPQYINKIIKGNENLTIETMSRLEDSLGIEILALPKERKEISKYGNITDYFNSDEVFMSYDNNEYNYTKKVV